MARKNSFAPLTLSFLHRLIEEQTSAVVAANATVGLLENGLSCSSSSSSSSSSSKQPDKRVESLSCSKTSVGGSARIQKGFDYCPGAASE